MSVLDMDLKCPLERCAKKMSWSDTSELSTLIASIKVFILIVLHTNQSDRSHCRHGSPDSAYRK